MSSRDKQPDDEFDVSLLEGLRERISQEAGDGDDDILSPRSTRKNLLFGVAIGIAAAAGAAWFVVGGQPSGEPIPEPKQLPVIKAEKAPVKVRPADPGGMDVPNQDKLVYNRVAKTTQQPEVEHLLPPPAEPKALPKEEKPKAIDALGDGMAPLPKQAKTPEPIKAPVTKVAKVKVTPVKEPEPAKAVQKKPVVKPEVKEVKKVVKAPTVKPTAVAKPAPKPMKAAVTATGDWQVQLTALRDEKRAESAWVKTQKKAGGILDGVSHEIIRADLGSKGVFYRLRAGRFVERADASKLCTALKAKGVGCVVAKR